MTRGALRAAAHRYKSASTVRPESRGISTSLLSITSKGPRDLNCVTSGLRDSRYRWSSAGFADFIGVTSVTGNRRAQPIGCALTAISRRAGMAKPDRPHGAAGFGTALPRTIQGRALPAVEKLIRSPSISSQPALSLPKGRTERTGEVIE